MKRYWKKILYTFYILLTIGIIVYIYFSDPQLQDIGKALQQVNPFWIIVAFGGMFLFWFFDSCSVSYLSRMVNLKLSWLTCVRIALIGQFYGSITPCMSGAQPAQIIYMTKKEIPASASTPTLVSKFLLWQIVEGFVATISIPYCWGRITSVSGPLVTLPLEGYVLNSIAIVGGVLAVVNQKVVSGICRFVCKIGLKFHLIRNSEKWMASTENFIKDYRESIKLLLQSGKNAAISILLVLCQLVSLFLVTYFVYLACTGEPFSITKMMDVFFMQSVLTISVNFIPVPGANGTSEGGFYLLFGQIFPGNMMFFGMIVWRFVTYYFNLLGGFLGILSDTFSRLGKHSQKDMAVGE